MIGILSDTHDNLHAVREAVHLFKSLDCELVIHAGDFIAPFAAKELGRLPCRIKAVFGNCDGEKKGLAAVIQPFGDIEESPSLFTWKGHEILLTHVDHQLDVQLAKHNPDFLIFGHTHKPEVLMRRKTLLINPGEAGGWVSGRKTVAILDLEKREAEVLSL